MHLWLQWKENRKIKHEMENHLVLNNKLQQMCYRIDVFDIKSKLMTLMVCLDLKQILGGFGLRYEDVLGDVGINGKGVQPL